MSDKVLDLRNCGYKGADLQKKVLSGALMSGADYTGANLQVPLPDPLNVIFVSPSLSVQR